MARHYQKRRRIGDCDYEIRVDSTEDDRVEVTVVGCDGDGEIVAELAGVVPARHCAAVGTLIWRSAGGLRTYDVARIRERHPNAYAKWTPEADARLARMAAEGRDVEQLAAEFGRNTGAIRSRLAKLDLSEAVAGEARTVYEELEPEPGARSKVDEQEPPF